MRRSPLPVTPLSAASSAVGSGCSGAATRGGSVSTTSALRVRVGADSRKSAAPLKPPASTSRAAADPSTTSPNAN